MPARSARNSISYAIIARHLPISPLLCCIALGTVGCAGTRALPRDRRGEAVVDRTPPVESVDMQYLYRVRYSGPAGSGGLRLVMRLGVDEEFQLQAADALGRSMWILDYRSGWVQIIDHRRQTFCQTENDLRVAEVTLETFSIQTLPRLLLGRVPVIPEGVSRDDGSVDFTDASGRKWSVRTEDNQITAWTLWSQDEPILWWTRQSKGGILSHREGSQFRWRQVVEEPLDSELQLLTPPESYQQTSCDESDLPQFRQDQPPSAGGESSP